MAAINPPSEFLKNCTHSPEQVVGLFAQAQKNHSQFWLNISKRISWSQTPTVSGNYSFRPPVKIEWFADGILNATVSCIDRHAEKTPDRIAFYWEPDTPQDRALQISYAELLRQVSRVSHTLKKLGVKKGDRVTVYLPMIPEAVYTILACARIGAVHSVIFAGFSADSIADRIEDGKSEWLVTATHGRRGGKRVDLLKQVTDALTKTDRVQRVLVFDHPTDRSVLAEQIIAPQNTQTLSGRVNGDQLLVAYSEVSRDAQDFIEPEMMNAEDPLFLLYTSGSTNKPKGVLHTTGGYLTYASFTHELVFDYKPSDIYWCAADVGWITGHSYIVYGPLANGATSVLYEGVPNFPDASRIWQIVDKYKVSLLYTAPTAIRALRKEGDNFVHSTSRKTLRILGSVGEPINPEAWKWYFETVGDGRCPVVDTWWQTETGGIMISPLPSLTDLKPGSATRPLPGIGAALLNEKSEVLEGAAEGHLVLTQSWPGQMRTVYGDHERFEQTYFSTHPGYYVTGDGARRDDDGYFWITGRVDDVLNVSGHRLGTAELESSFVAHPSVAEAAVVGIEHDIKGQGIYAYVVLKQHTSDESAAKKELTQWVRQHLSPIATPDAIQIAQGLPKTRSGKIMRRILRKIAERQYDQLGDTTTLADPHVVDELVAKRKMDT